MELRDESQAMAYEPEEPPRPEDRAPEVATPIRTAVILAAGLGQRFTASDLPKPMVPVMGVPLLERTVLSLERAGVTRFVVVLGHRADEVEALLARRSRLRGLDLELVRAPDWDRGNGASLRAGAQVAGGPFVLTMADHVLDPSIPARLIEAARAHPGDVLLAVDAPERVFDLDDATKVRRDGTEDGPITAIGKDLGTYDAIDVGVFACPAWIAAHLRDQGPSSVSEVMREAIARGAMRACPIEGALWQDVDTPEMAREAERRLLASTRKATDGPVSRYLNRPISLALTRQLARWPITPNMITTVVFAMGMVAAGLMTSTSSTALIIAALLTQGASVLDGCDGELARVKLMGTRFGAWYDTLTDNVRYIAMVVASAIGVYRRDGHVVYVVVAVAFTWCAIWLVTTMTRHLRENGSSGTHLVILDKIRAREGDLHGRRLYRALLFLRPLGKQDSLALIGAVVLAAQVPEVGVMLGMFCVLAMCIVVQRALAPTRSVGDSIRWWLGLAGAVLLAYLLASAPLAQVAQTLRGMGIAWLLSIPIVLLWTAANAAGLRSLTQGRVGFLLLVRNKLIGDGWSALLPLGSLGGDPIRYEHLARLTPAAVAARAVVADRMINIVSGLSFAAVAVPLGLRELHAPMPLKAAASAFAAVSLVAAILLSFATMSRSVAKLLDRIAGRFAGSFGGSLRLRPRTFVTVLGWNLIGRWLALAEVMLYLILLDQPIAPAVVLFLGGLMTAVGTVTFMIPQGVGVAEAASTYGLGLLGAATPVGLAFGLARRARIMLFAGIGVGLQLLSRSTPPLRLTRVPDPVTK